MTDDFYYHCFTPTGKNNYLIKINEQLNKIADSYFGKILFGAKKDMKNEIKQFLSDYPDCQLDIIDLDEMYLKYEEKNISLYNSDIYLFLEILLEKANIKVEYV